MRRCHSWQVGPGHPWPPWPCWARGAPPRRRSGACRVAPSGGASRSGWPWRSGPSPRSNRHRQDRRGLGGLGLLPVLLARPADTRGSRRSRGPPCWPWRWRGVTALAHRSPALGRASVRFPVVLIVYLGVAAGRVPAAGGSRRGRAPLPDGRGQPPARPRRRPRRGTTRPGRYGPSIAETSSTPHYRVRGKDGEIYSLHALGLSILILPAYAVGGYVGPRPSSWRRSPVPSPRSYERLLGTSSRSGEAAELAAFVVALSPPLLSYAGLVFTEVPAALGVALVASPRSPPRATSGAEGPSASAPCSRSCRGSTSAMARSPCCSSSTCSLGRPGRARSAPASGPARRVRSGPRRLSPRPLRLRRSAAGVRPPARSFLSGRPCPRALPGLLLDQEFGLLVYAPVLRWRSPAGLRWLAQGSRLALGRPRVARDGRGPPPPPGPCGGAASTRRPLPGAHRARPRPRRGERPSCAACAFRGPPRRAGASGWESRGRPSRGWSTGIATARPLILRAVSGAEEWTRLLPGFVLEDPTAAEPRGGVGSGTLCGRPVARTTERPWAGLGATVGLLAAAGAHQCLSHASTGGREAVRVVGRPALAGAGLSFQARATGEWRTDVRRAGGRSTSPIASRSGAVLGERLALAGGSLPAGAAGPRSSTSRPIRRCLRVEAVRLRTLAACRSSGCRGGAAVDFDLAAPERDLTLAPGRRRCAFLLEASLGLLRVQP